MTILDEEAARLLAEARQAFTPERRQAERVHAGVLAAVAVPEPELGDTATSGSNGAGAAGGGKALTATHGVGAWGGKAWLVGAALALGAASGAGVWAFGASEPPPRAASPSKPRDELRPASPSPSEAVAPAASAVASAEEHEQTATASGRVTPPPVPAGSGVPELALRDELKSVREAERALNAGEPGRALAVLEKLQRFRGGSLREERAALRVLANCLLATSTSGDHARRFLSTYPKSFYAPRIRAACSE